MTFETFDLSDEGSRSGRHKRRLDPQSSARKRKTAWSRSRKTRIFNSCENCDISDNWEPQILATTHTGQPQQFFVLMKIEKIVKAKCTYYLLLLLHYNQWKQNAPIIQKRLSSSASSEANIRAASTALLKSDHDYNFAPDVMMHFIIMRQIWNPDDNDMMIKLWQQWWQCWQWWQLCQWLQWWQHWQLWQRWQWWQWQKWWHQWWWWWQWW